MVFSYDTASPSHALHFDDVALCIGHILYYRVLLEHTLEGLAAAEVAVDAFGEVGGEQMLLADSQNNGIPSPRMTGAILSMYSSMRFFFLTKSMI